MNRIRFAADWDKLGDPRFTTIRSYRSEKETFYCSKVGQDFAVVRVRHAWQNVGRQIGTATLRSVRVIVPLADLKAGELERDVQVNGAPDDGWRMRILHMPKALLLEFENHTGIFREANR